MAEKGGLHFSLEPANSCKQVPSDKDSQSATVKKTFWIGIYIEMFTVCYGNSSLFIGTLSNKIGHGFHSCRDKPRSSVSRRMVRCGEPIVWISFHHGYCVSRKAYWYWRPGRWRGSVESSVNRHKPAKSETHIHVEQLYWTCQVQSNSLWPWYHTTLRNSDKSVPGHMGSALHQASCDLWNSRNVSPLEPRNGEASCWAPSSSGSCACQCRIDTGRGGEISRKHTKTLMLHSNIVGQ